MRRAFHALLSIGTAAGFWLAAASADAQGPVLPMASASLPLVEVTAEVKLDDSGRPSMVSGRMRLSNLPHGQELCLYVPYNDPEYGQDRGAQRRLDALSGRTPKAVFDGGETLLTALAPHTLVPAGPYPFVERVLGAHGGAPANEVTLSFESVVPRLPASAPHEWFYDGFFPLLARSCASADLHRLYHRLVAQTRIDMTVRLPSGYSYVGPGEETTGTARVKLTGATAAFGLVKGVLRRDFDAGTVHVRLYRRSSDFDAIVPTVQASLAELEKIFGPYPYPSLTLVESAELQRHGLPGLIALDQPRQAVFNQAQRDWMNWQHWIITTALAHQWFGGVVTAASPDDEWLIGGIVEYATLETLRKQPQRYNLFNPTSSGYRWLSFDYQQVSEITAATLARHAPFSRLTDAKHATALPLVEQNGMLFVKQAFALRQMAAYAGDQPFYGFMRNLTREHWFKAMAPRDFAAYLRRLPSPFSPLVRRQLAGFLDRWWTEEGFPDFVLDKFERVELEGGRWLTRVTAEQDGKIDFPPMIGVRDESGRQVFVRAAKKAPVAGEEPVWTAEVISAYEPVEVTVDPLHETFDVDRFDNSSRWPSVNFFPGGATTLRDDDYTVVWVPYPFRRPGEPFSIGLQSAVFRYTQGGLYLRAEGAPSTRKGAIEARHRYEIARHALHGDLSVRQSYEGDRVGELSLVRSPIIPGDPSVSVAGRLRRKEHVGRPEEAHASGVLGMAVRPGAAGGDCVYNVSAEIENAPEELSHYRFAYERKVGAASLGCAFTPRTSASVRLFGGVVYRKGETPESALFKPNDLKEAKLRLDLGLDRVTRIGAANFDVLLPIYLPLPDDSLVLTRQMRLRVFHDRGRSFDLGIDYQASGVGLQMPLGGDLSGAGALSFTQLALLVVLDSRAGDQRSRKPGFLLDLTGEL